MQIDLSHINIGEIITQYENSSITKKHVLKFSYYLLLLQILLLQAQNISLP